MKNISKTDEERIKDLFSRQADLFIGELKREEFDSQNYGTAVSDGILPDLRELIEKYHPGFYEKK